MPRLRQRSNFTVAILFIGLVLVMIFMDDMYQIVANHMKNSYLHNQIQSLSQKIEYAREAIESMNGSKIYFVHIPRTASDSIRAHMMGKVPLVLDRSSYHDETLDSKLLLKKDDVKKFEQYLIIKGFFSFNDLNQHMIWMNRHHLFITVLRDPIERILSLYEFSNHGMLLCRIDRPLTLKEFLTSNQSTIQSLINNSITWQLGYHLSISERQNFASKYNLSLNDNQTIEMVYQYAKVHLKRFTFVGFYENLMYDYNEMNTKIFSKLNKNRFLLNVLFNLGTWFGFPKMRVLKYNARVKHDPEIQSILHGLTSYDTKLYQFAKNDLRQLNFRVFDSYFDFICFMAIRFFTLIGLMLGVQFLWSRYEVKVRRFLRKNLSFRSICSVSKRVVW